MARPVPIMRYADRLMQGDYFHLTTIEWSRNVMLPYHGHDFPELFWLVSGHCEHRINGECRILGPGALVLMRPEDRHQLCTVSGRSFTFTNLAFHPGHWRELCRQHPDPLGPLYDPAPAQPVTHQLAERDLHALQHDAYQLASRNHSLFSLDRFLFSVWGLCADAAENTGPRDAQEMPDWLREACLRIQEPEFFRQGVPALVELCGRSHEHVSRVCRSHLGQTPSQVVTAARLARAATDLRTTTQSVTEIALGCGFEAPSQFYRLFKAAYGTTPRRYRHPR